MLLEQTREYILALSDEALIEFVLDGTYGPEAVAFAAEEIKRRDLDPQRLIQLKAVATARVQARRTVTTVPANQQLSASEKRGAFIHGLILFLHWPSLGMVLFSGLGSKNRKNRERRKYIVMGFLTMRPLKNLLLQSQ